MFNSLYNAPMAETAVYNYINDLNNDPSKAISYTTQTDIMYPDPNQYNILGPVYLPKVYGKDLTAFEIASSGKIAVTIKDFYSLDLDRPTDFEGHSNTTMLQTQSNGNFLLTTTESNAYMFLNADEGKVKLFGSTELTGSNLLFNTVDAHIHILEKEINYYANSNHTFTTSNNFIVEAEQGLSLTASNADIKLQALTGTTSLATVNTHINSLQDSIDVYALKDVDVESGEKFNVVSGGIITMGASNNINIQSDTGDMTLETKVGSIKTYTPQTHVVMSPTSFDVFAAESADITLGSDFNMTTSNTITTWSSNAITLTTQDGDMILQSINGANLLKAKDAFVSLAQDRADIYTLTETNFTAGDNFMITSSNAFSMWASNNITTTSQEGDIQFSTLDGSIQLKAPQSSITLTHDSLIAKTEKTMDIEANDNISIKTFQNASLIAASNITFASETSSIIAQTPNANVNIFNDSISARALLNVDVLSSNITTFQALSNMNLSSGDTFQVQAENTISMKTVTNESMVMKLGEIASSTDTQHSFWLNGEIVPRVIINSNGMRLQGDLDIQGSINSINLTETTLEILDKTIIVSAGSNLTDLEMDASGLVVGGDEAMDKSLLWYNNTGGVADMGKHTSVDTESYWELKGGALRMTHSNISFSFRIGENNELELVKKVGTGLHKVVARFGRTLL